MSKNSETMLEGETAWTLGSRTLEGSDGNELRVVSLVTRQEEEYIRFESDTLKDLFGYDGRDVLDLLSEVYDIEPDYEHFEMCDSDYGWAVFKGRG